MSDLGFTFNAADVEPSRPAGDPFPNGKYVMAIVESETVPTKAGDGTRLNLTFEILEGDYKGRKMWEGLNIKNPNPTAQKIAMADLSAICHATGVLQLTSAAQLHNIPLVVSVKIKQEDGTDANGEKYPPKNVAKGYFKFDGAAPVLTASTTKAAATPKGPLVAPWAKGAAA